MFSAIAGFFAAAALFAPALFASFVAAIQALIEGFFLPA